MTPELMAMVDRDLVIVCLSTTAANLIGIVLLTRTWRKRMAIVHDKLKLKVIAEARKYQGKTAWDSVGDGATFTDAKGTSYLFQNGQWVEQ